MSGPSGAGKTRLKEMFLAFPRKYQIIESYTTRKKRGGENGQQSEYVFVSGNTFIQMVEKGHFAWHIQYDGEYYGTLKKSLENGLLSNKISVMILVPDMVATLREQIKALGGVPEKQIESFYISAPEKDLKERMQRRGDSTRSIETRLLLIPLQEKTREELGLITIENPNDKKPSLVFQEMVQTFLNSPQV